MGMRFKIEVEVEVERLEGKFATRAEIEEEIQDIIQSADPGSIDGVGPDSATNYGIVFWEASAVSP